MIDFVNKYARNVHSQNGEDGLVTQCVNRIGLAHGYAVEIGANDGMWMSNTRNLIEHGWQGLMVEADWNLYQRCRDNWKGNPGVRVQCSIVDGKNINAFVDDSCDVFSSDTDGADYEIFKGLIAKPKIVIVEIDSSIPPDNREFNSDGASGYLPMVELGIAKGYFLLCHTGNLIFVDRQYRELFPEIIGDGLSNPELYFKRDWMKAA